MDDREKYIFRTICDIAQEMNKIPDTDMIADQCNIPSSTVMLTVRVFLKEKLILSDKTLSDRITNKGWAEYGKICGNPNLIRFERLYDHLGENYQSISRLLHVSEQEVYQWVKIGAPEMVIDYLTLILHLKKNKYPLDTIVNMIKSQESKLLSY